MFCDRAFQRISDKMWSIVVEINGLDGHRSIAKVGTDELICGHHRELVVRTAHRGVTVKRLIKIQLSSLLVDAEEAVDFEAGPFQRVAHVVGALHIGICCCQL